MNWKALLRVALAVPVCIIVAFALMSLMSRRPDNLGVADMRLNPCPASPNCVCSDDADPAHAVEPIRYTDGYDARMYMDDVIHNMPGAQIISQVDGYYHVEFTSRVFRFVDDVELLFDDEAHLVHIRSASRAGYSDLGVNRARVEEIRRRYNEQANRPNPFGGDSPMKPPSVIAKVNANERAAIQKVITAQLKALADDDAKLAYSFSDEQIRMKFPTPEIFMEMIQKSYSCLTRAQDVEFLTVIPGKVLEQLVKFRDPADPKEDKTAAFGMRKEQDGTWRVIGCRLIDPLAKVLPRKEAHLPPAPPISP